MKLSIHTPAKSLNKAYLRQSLKREQIELFKGNLAELFRRIKPGESEEHQKNLVIDFLKDTWYKPDFEINTSGRKDLVIQNGRSSTDPVGVIIEVKSLANKNEMLSPDRPNVKALHELLHYYMQERYIKENQEIKRLIICNIYEWYIFDATDFERFFFDNQKLVKSYKDWNSGLLVSSNTDWFYQEIAKKFIEDHLNQLPCTCFDLRDFTKKVDDNRLVHLYKILSPPHLLKQPFANDSNSLNREFYNELLHIIGLEEVKEKGKKLIRRKAEGERYPGSLLENTIDVLRTRNRGGMEPTASGSSMRGDDSHFETALELCINWLDRLLFLKLLEGQLITYHKGDSAYAFLNIMRIADFDELNELFFEVLAVRLDERTASVRERFGNIPYLNSSLFEESDLERATIRINELKNRHDLPLYRSTVLKDGSGRRFTGNKNTLSYLFEFLDAYDFASEGCAEIQEQNKTIINASVLGLIFEKINGYRDGSFFTPGFITMYICRESIRRAALRKFNERYGWDCADVKDLHNDIFRQRISISAANEMVNSLRICDPAVGSGHFLVSALNEIIAIKSDLGILADKDGKLIRCDIAVENDELIVTVDDHIFEYNFKDQESQRVQETLFHEKETIIENCLFGVDINPKSVAICRLRLWIELLKNAYYRRGTKELETLPNIDINIKCGNSLVSRFAVAGIPNAPAAQRKKMKELTSGYRDLVLFYKHSPSNKAELRKRIDNLKHDLENFGLPNDRDLVALRRKENEVAQLGFAFDKQGMEARQKLLDEVAELKKRFAEKERQVYANAFEWRFEFPEILDSAGEFIGFDTVIGNPPYIRQEAIKEQKPAFMEMFGDFYCGTADIYTYFYKTGLTLLKQGGLLCYIAPNKFMRAGYGRNTRTLLTSEATPLQVLDFGDLPVFEEATTYPSIVMVEKNPPVGAALRGRPKSGQPQGVAPTKPDFLTATFTDIEQLKCFDERLPSIGFTMPVVALKEDGWTLERPAVLQLMEKLRKAGKPLGEYVEGKFYRGVLTGLNEAFVIDDETRQRLIAEDPRSEEIIKPWLRGRDIRKWKAKWAGLYLITIASSANRGWPWSNEKSEDAARLLFESAYPAIHRHLLQWEEKLRKRDDQGKFWWELRACVYWEEFEKPKISWSHFATVPEFVYDEERFLSNDKSYIMPTDDLSIFGILNSRITNFFIGQLSPPVRGGFMELRKIYLEQLPIPIATDSQKAPIIERVQRILADPDSPEVPRLETEINRLVFALYGLTEEEMALVEGERRR